MAQVSRRRSRDLKVSNSQSLWLRFINERPRRELLREESGGQSNL